MLKPGMSLNNQYKVIKEIGSGGGGIIYKAYHENLKKYVVIKQIKDVAKEVLDSRAEADILKNLHNSYLPQVYDFLEINNEIYTVIDFIDGKTLEEEVREKGKLDQKDVLRWARQLAEALAYLHSRIPPIIHSDIKPANIMLTPEGDICLIDFNVSLAFDKNKRTSAGVSSGFSPPEQYRDIKFYRSVTGIDITKETAFEDRKTEYIGDSSARKTEFLDISHNEVFNADKAVHLTKKLIGKGVDERSDIYSLGATLYYLLTGMVPPDDFSKTIPIGKCHINISEAFCRIIEKMMELEPEKRYQNGTELYNALKDIKKLDSLYKRYMQSRIVTAVCICGLYAVSGVLIAAGISTLDREKANKYNQTVEQADALISDGRYSEAGVLIDEAISQIPTRIDAYEKEALKLYAEGQYHECIAYGRGIINSPDYYVESDTDKEYLGNIMYILGNAYYETGDYQNSIICFETAIEYNADNSAYYRDLGITYAREGNTENANRILDMAQQVGLTEPYIFMIQGEVAYSEGDASKAVERYKEALALLNNDGDIQRCVALCVKAYEQLGESYINEEISFLEQWIYTLGDRSGLILKEELGEAYAKAMRYEDALSEFLEIRKTGYTSYQLMENIAILYQQTGQQDQARIVLNEMLGSYPKRYETYKRLAFLEADIQQGKANGERSYIVMRDYYEKASELYAEQPQTDMEMQQLANMMQELYDGNWF